MLIRGHPGLTFFYLLVRPSSTFCLDTKRGAKNSRQKQMLCCFCRARAQVI